MENNKDIGQIFRERLDGIQKNPNPKVWQDIQKELQQKKKRRMLPFWIWFAAGILLLGSVGYLVLEKTDFPNPNNDDLNEGTDKTVEVSDKDTKNDRDTTSKTATEAFRPDPAGKNPEALTNRSEATPDEKRSEKNALGNRKLHRKGKTHASNGKNISGKNGSGPIKSASISPDSIQTQIGTTNNNTDIADNELQLRKNHMKSSNDSTGLAKAKDSLENLKKEKAIELKMFAEKKPDSAGVKFREYYIFAHGSPSISNLASKKSLIDQRLDDSGTTSEIVFNYGVYAGMQINDKWDIRVGVHRTELKLETTDIPLQTFSNFTNIDYDPGKSNASIANQLDDTAFNLMQSFEYLEVPLEVKYKLYNQKLSIQAIGGFSTLFLNKKEVFVTAANNGQELQIGHTKDMKDVAFSANIGLGFNYRLTKNIQFNLEPVFRYQFTSSFNDAKLFTLQLQTGLQFTLNPKK